MSLVFVDTVAFLALWDKADQWHDSAFAAFARVFRENHVLVTTSYVLFELGNAACRKPYRQSVLDLRGEMLASENLIEATPDECLRAWAAYAKHDAGNAGIIDLISFEVMRRLNIADALTNDEHFRAAGFHTLM